MKFNTAKEYIEYLDEQSGESWSNATDELADVMEDYAKMYHERQLKLLGVGVVVGQSEQLPCEHEYKAIYLGMGYVRQCQKCGDTQQ